VADPDFDEESERDPSEPAECGIVAAGLGEDGHAYVFKDASDLLTAAQWGERVVEVADEHKADDIVAEVNNGGALVGVNIRAAAEHLKIRLPRYREVHASRGKRTRAEPVSALYEQRRVHHVGTMPNLEDQMCTWVPGNKSPDRMDALVWAITWLMLEKKRRSGAFGS
jgi:phage terminase large subunit-like protein